MRCGSGVMSRKECARTNRILQGCQNQILELHEYINEIRSEILNVEFQNKRNIEFLRFWNNYQHDNKLNL